jgi:hypothetical protein
MLALCQKDATEQNLPQLSPEIIIDIFHNGDYTSKPEPHGVIS